MPASSLLLPQDLNLALVQFLNRFQALGVLGHEGAFLEQLGDFCEVGFFGKPPDVFEEVFLWDAGEGVLDSGRWVCNLAGVSFWFVCRACKSALENKNTYSPETLLCMLATLCLRMTASATMEPRWAKDDWPSFSTCVRELDIEVRPLSLRI